MSKINKYDKFLVKTYIRTDMGQVVADLIEWVVQEVYEGGTFLATSSNVLIDKPRVFKPSEVYRWE